MVDLAKHQAKICLTASGMLLRNEQVLLIRHKKLDCWLCPGGHIDSQELPHKAAEREFFEETGVLVKAADFLFQGNSDRTQFFPSPIETNLHWVSRSNYQQRLASSNPDKRVKTKLWPKGCEQHLNLVYLVTLEQENQQLPELKPNQREVTNIGWFDQQQLEKIKASQDLKQQIDHGLKIMSQFKHQPFYH